MFMKRDSVCPCSAILCLFLSVLALGQSSDVKGTSRVNAVNDKIRAAAEMMHAQPPNYDQAIATLKEAKQMAPNADVVWYELGVAYLQSAKTQTDAAESTKRGTEAYKNLERAIALYKRNSESQRQQADSQGGGGLDMSRLKSQPTRVTGAPEPTKPEASRTDNHKLAAYYDMLGEAASQLGKTDEAAKNFQQAAQLDSAEAATYYFNLGIILRNTARTVDEKKKAVEAFDKAIAADPNKADAYYVKGEVLFGMATTDSNGKTVAPPGTVEALQKYVELQPNSPNAGQAKSFLAALNAPAASNGTDKGTSKNK